MIIDFSLFYFACKYCKISILIFKRGIYEK